MKDSRERKCANPNCNELSVDHHRGGKGLCQKHRAARKERQRRSAQQPNCAHCPNKAPLNHTLCSACQRDQEEEEFQQWLRERFGDRRYEE